MASKVKKRKPPKRRTAGSELIDNRVEALRHHIRRQILAHLINEGPSSASKMGKAFGESTEDAAYHLRRLVELRCVEVADELSQNGRPVQKIYRATERYLVATEDWDALDPASKEGISGEWAQLFVDDLVDGFKAETLGTHRHFALIQNRIAVDEQGRDEALEIEERAMREIQDVQARALGRLSAEEPGINMSVLQACFEVPPR
jgi:DNA-binding PadR family transcriptional regulator